MDWKNEEEIKEKMENLNSTINHSDVWDIDGILQLTAAEHTVPQVNLEYSLGQTRVSLNRPRQQAASLKTYLFWQNSMKLKSVTEGKQEKLENSHIYGN